jgi:hypothetical protein
MFERCFGATPTGGCPTGPTVRISGLALALLFLSLTVLVGGPSSQDVLPEANLVERDPGVRPGPAGAGGPLSGLNAATQRFFSAGLAPFQEMESVQGTTPGTGAGLGHGLTWTVALAVMCNPRWEDRVRP